MGHSSHLLVGRQWNIIVQIICHRDAEPPSTFLTAGAELSVWMNWLISSSKPGIVSVQVIIYWTYLNFLNSYIGGAVYMMYYIYLDKVTWIPKWKGYSNYYSTNCQLKRVSFDENTRHKTEGNSAWCPELRPPPTHTTVILEAVTILVPVPARAPPTCRPLSSPGAKHFPRLFMYH